MRLWRPVISGGIPVLAALAAGLMAGCGLLTVERTVFPDAVVGTDGTPITRAEIDSVLNDENLSDAEKADALRELGIEDEELLELLINL